MKSSKRNIFILVCILPTLALFCLFVIYPTTQVLVKSFYRWSGVTSKITFVGLENYKNLMKDSVFILSFKNTIFLLVVAPIITLFLSLFFAVILTQFNLKGRNFFRTVFYFPNILAMVVISVLWAQVYHPRMGILNSILDFIGLDNLKHAWLGDEKTVMWCIVATMVWQAVGYYMVLYIAGIDGIPSQLFEAATVDGANGIQKFFNVTIPMLWEVIRVTIVFQITGVLSMSFILSSVMTSGGPNRKSEVILTYMYHQAFNNANFGYAMAICVCVLFFSISVAFISIKVTERN